MLFQPTNISPSTFGGLGNGTVDVNDGIEVSWQVNGNSPMVAFSIIIYRNDTASTQLYTTGKKTTNCPFYGTDYAGNINFFRYTITAAQLSSAGISNGGEYKLKIRQWWDNSHSVTLSSAAAFITRDTPTVVINNLPQSISTRTQTFNALYSQAQNDGIMWVRWRIATVNNTEYDILYDSGNIYGTSQLQVSYDGFFTGNTYAIRCDIQTVNGIEADTGWQTFDVDYPSATPNGYLSASYAKNTMGVYVTWLAVKRYVGEATGLYTADGNLHLPSGVSATWDETVDGEAMSISEPWTVIWSGDTEDSAVTPLTLITGNNNTVTVAISSSAITLTSGGSTLFTQSLTGANYGRYIVVLRQDSIAVQFRAYGNDGLYPNSSLYPSTTLYPSGDTLPNTPIVYISTFPQISGDIESITLAGPSNSDYLYIAGTRVSDSVVNTIMSTIDYEPSSDWITPTVFYANFDDTIDSTFTNGYEAVEGFAVYRLETGKTTLEHIIDVPADISQIIDYSANANKEYTYFLFAIGEDTYATSPLASNAIVPRWNMWSVLECDIGNDGNYHPIAEYKFNKNLVSGAISNNNAPTILENFTRYPLIQPKSSNFKSGALVSLIGIVSMGEYSDTMALTNAIYALSNSRKTMFLKSRKGDVLQIRPSAPIEMTLADATAEQATTMSLPWTEIGDDNGLSIVSTPDDAFWNSSDIYQSFITSDGQVFTVLRGDALGNQYRSAYTGKQIDTAITKIIYAGNAIVVVAENVVVTSWQADSTYAGYGYRATVPVAGVTADMIPDVTFDIAQAMSGDYAPVANCYNGGVYLYSKSSSAITVLSIVCTKEGEN